MRCAGRLIRTVRSWILFLEVFLRRCSASWRREKPEAFRSLGEEELGIGYWGLPVVPGGLENFVQFFVIPAATSLSRSLSLVSRLCVYISLGGTN